MVRPLRIRVARGATVNDEPEPAQLMVSKPLPGPSIVTFVPASKVSPLERSIVCCAENNDDAKAMM